MLKTMILLGTTAMLITACTCTPPIMASVPVTMRPQETNMWCWAASGQMVMETLAHNVAQCTEANNRFGRTDCCNSPTPASCVQGGWPEFNKYGFVFTRTASSALSWETIRQEIFCHRRPIAFSWAWTGGGGHMMVIFGYATVNAVNYVAINDPWPPNVGDQRMLTYDAYVSGTGYSHWDDFYGVRYTGTVTP